jgi:hypothetical protein
MSGTGWSSRTLRRDWPDPASAAPGPGQYAGHGGGNDASDGHGQPTTPAEPSAMDDDLIDVWHLPGRPAGPLRRPERLAERIEIGHGSFTARHRRGGVVVIGRYAELGERA